MMSLSAEVLARPLREADPQVHAAIADELDRQQSTLEMIASRELRSASPSWRRRARS